MMGFEATIYRLGLVGVKSACVYCKRVVTRAAFMFGVLLVSSNSDSAPAYRDAITSEVLGKPY